MNSAILLAVVIFLTFNYSVVGNSCGGLLEGENGLLNIASSSNQEAPETPSSSSCLWIIQLHYKTGLRFTLDALGDGALLNLYPEEQLTLCNLSTNYTKLNTTHVGSSFDFLGQTLIVILPNSSASVTFSWHFIANEEDKKISMATMKNADYVSSSNGLLEWEQLESVERVTWGINTDANFHINWKVDGATSCDNAVDICSSFYFAIFKLTSQGVLSEAVRTCGQSSEGKLEGTSGRVVVLVKVNAQVEANKVTVSWGLDDVITEPPVEVTTTQPPVTVSPGPIATVLFAGTERGLVSLNLKTLEATSLTSEEAYAVAVNQNLQKVYWSELPRSSRIMRSNFNGSDAEVIVPPTGQYMIALAIHEPSGNIYFSVQSSNEITVCNALGVNCAVVISNSTLANNPWSIAIDSEHNVIYWSNYDPRFSTRSSLIRANLDGTSVREISSRDGSTGIAGITLEQPSYNTLYWADNHENIIGTMDVNGGNNRTLVELKNNPQLWGIQVDAHKIYFSSYYARTIQSVDRVSGEELTTLFNSTGGMNHIALFYAPD